MTTFMTNPSDLDLHLEPHFDGTGELTPSLQESLQESWQESVQTSVANPRRTTWTGFAKADRDRMPAT